MDKLLKKYVKRIDENPDEFFSEEFIRFPQGYSFEDKIKSEYMSIHAYYYDKNSNEAYYDSNQVYVILDTLEEIKELIRAEDYETASYVLVSLQLIMGLDIKLTRVIYEMIRSDVNISYYVDKDKYFGNTDSKKDKRNK